MNHPDAAIVGAGIVGCSIAYELAKKGLRVTVVDRGPIGREASWAAGGILTPVHLADYPSALAELCVRAQEGYAAFVEEIRGSEDPELRRTGLLLLVRDDRDAQIARTLEEWKRARGQPVELRSDGLFLPDVHQVRNPRLTRAIAEAAKRCGAEFRENTPVAGFLRVPGRVHGIRTSSGDLHAGTTILAAGAWSGEEAAKLGIALPVKPMKGQMLLVETEPETVPSILLHRELYLVPRADGRVLIGSTLEDVGFDKRVTAGATEHLLARAIEMCPALEGATLLASWAGLRPGTPDRLPYLGRAPGWEGLVVATGHYRNGILLGPITGASIREVVEGRTPPELAPFALDRVRASP